ncbi:266_t:CDS:2, partial [Paraglomus occultum]
IGAWQHVDNSRTRPYEYMQVWDGISDSRLSFDLDNIKSDAIAWIVENNHIQRAILARLEECYNGNVDVFDGTKVEKIFYESESGNEFDLSDWPTVFLSSGKTLKARLLVGADGINSAVRSFAGIDMLGWDYDANAVVATLHVDPLVENKTAWQRFLPTGPIAMLPAMWSTIPALASKLRLLPESDFVHLVNAAFRLRLADLQYFQSQLLEGGDINLQDEITWREQVETKNIADENMDKDRILPPRVFGVQEKSRASFPLKMRNAERYVKERITLIGDAAHTIHPLAGQGLNQGIADVQCLTQTIQAGVNTGQNIGDLELLGEYSSARYLPNLAMIGAVDKLHKLYATEFGPIVWSRSIGLNAINRMSPLKAEIMKFAMGIGTDTHG